SDERRDVEFTDRDRAAEAWTNRRRGLDPRIVAGSFEADLAVDDDAHAVTPDFPGDLVPLVGRNEAFVLQTMLFGGRRIVYAELADVAFPVEDQLAAMKVHPKIRRVGLADDAKHKWRPAHERGDSSRHHPVHRRSRNLNAVINAGDHASLVRDKLAD